MSLPLWTSVKGTVFVTHVESGETRSFEDEYAWNTEGNDYMWSEGNYSCDCNRALFFARAAGKPDPDVPCTDDQYVVRIVVDGKTVYEE